MLRRSGTFAHENGDDGGHGGHGGDGGTGGPGGQGGSIQVFSTLEDADLLFTVDHWDVSGGKGGRGGHGGSGGSGGLGNCLTLFSSNIFHNSFPQQKTFYLLISLNRWISGSW